MRRTTTPNPTNGLKQERGTITMNLDLEVWKQTKHQAIEEGRYPGHIVEDLLRAYLKHKKGDKVAGVLGVKKR